MNKYDLAGMLRTYSEMCAKAETIRFFILEDTRLSAHGEAACAALKGGAK